MFSWVPASYPLFQVNGAVSLAIKPKSCKASISAKADRYSGGLALDAEIDTKKPGDYQVNVDVRIHWCFILGLVGFFYSTKGSCKVEYPTGADLIAAATYYKCPDRALFVRSPYKIALWSAFGTQEAFFAMQVLGCGCWSTGKS